VSLSFCLAYYRNPGMLAEQFRIWASYPDELKAQIEIIVGDDGSPERADAVPRPDGLPPLRIFRLKDAPDPETPPWRQDAIRNRAAYMANGPWLFLTDMDHVLPAESLRKLLLLCERGDLAYTFHRLDAPDLKPKLDARGNIHPHPNTFAMTKARYWRIGGYDEEFCGIYGTDGWFRRRTLDSGSNVHLDDVPIVRYSREVIPDASTRTDREAARRRGYVQGRISDKVANKEPLQVLTVEFTE
jgi:hypothetical protein